MVKCQWPWSKISQARFTQIPLALIRSMVCHLHAIVNKSVIILHHDYSLAIYSVCLSGLDWYDEQVYVLADTLLMLSFMTAVYPKGDASTKVHFSYRPLISLGKCNQHYTHLPLIVSQHLLLYFVYSEIYFAIFIWRYGQPSLLSHLFSRRLQIPPRPKFTYQLNHGLPSGL